MSGAKVFNKYQILGELGRGGMGVVYKAYDNTLKTTVALKIMTNNEKEYVERFFVETTTVAKLNHPNIVRFYECGGQPRAYFTMEYIEGATLSHFIRNKSLKPMQLVDLLMPLCEALHYAHSHKVIHRDLKPSNIMITRDGVPKVMDFGLAKRSDMAKLSKTGQMLGTVHYMSPEQVAGEASFASDIYSFGALMYEALTYRTVYQGESDINIIVQINENTPIPLRQLNPDISPSLEAICLKCLQRNPRKRYSDFKQLLREFKNFKAHRPIIARKYSSWDVLANFVYKHKVICSSIALIFIILSCSLVITLKALDYAKSERLKAQKAAQKTMEEKEKTKESLNKVMSILRYSVMKYDALGQDEKFAALFSQIFTDLESYGENRDWNFIKGYISSQGGNTAKGLEYYAKQIKNNPQDPRAYNNRGGIYYRLQKYELALADFNKAIQIKPSLATAYRNRANVYRDTQQHNLALKDYKKFIDLEPQDANGYIDRAALHHDMGQYQLALNDFNKSVTLAPDNAETYYNRGIFYSDIQKYPLAIRDYTQAIQCNPQHAQAYLNRGLLYTRTQKYDLALQDYAQVEKLEPESVEVYTNRGNIYSRTKQYDLALENYNKAIAKDSRGSKAYYNRGLIYYTWKEYQKAIADFSQAIAIDPNYFIAYRTRGMVYYERQKYKLAIDDLNKALSISRNMWEIHYYLHLCYQRLNNTNKSQYHLKKSQQLKRG
ncbi:protein kinase domain-containing protein [Candidatus Uabimicrobium amorphum]|uniref:Serine/threonine protein kinase n=1 Tax=Uabimicrobium amorphum TaxID=2596890 RepID=A0A5S9IHY3_UABAM|nr:tetratricopeptide repeat protein [Candidatus Uabimicrobium amorphum]BBM82159.1 serine/threonine protein kinase [Candidatus Uabimicrobium amorphum]